jgi:8-oxo-dGTP pyrophosphatase MutT (NUDIX family)
VILRDALGRFFAHQRRHEKRSYPGLFGLGAGGRLRPGETPRAGATRELFEETGLRCAISECFEFAYQDAATSHQLFVFSASGELLPEHCAAEWQWSGWLASAEVDRLAHDGKLCPDTRLIYERLNSQPREHE